MAYPYKDLFSSKKKCYMLQHGWPLKALLHGKKKSVTKDHILYDSFIWNVHTKQV